jgi:hypothetical protein
MKGYETGTSAHVVVFVQFLGRVDTTGKDSTHIGQPSKLDRLVFVTQSLHMEVILKMQCIVV